MLRWTLLLMAACGSGDGDSATGPATGEPTVERAPNILILLADDMGQDAVGAYERHPNPPQTPVIDGLAASGVRFRNAWAYPVCSPTRAALLSGRYGRRHGVGDTINAMTSTRQMSTREVLLPRMLDQSPHGYTTIGAGKWHLAAWDSEDGANHPLVMGFDHFDGHAGNLNEGGFTNPEPTERGYYWHEWARDGVVEWSDAYATSETVDHTLERLAQVEEPWAAYVAFHAPHIPLEAPPAELGVVTTAYPSDPGPIYRAMVQAMDAEIGRLLDGLDPEVRDRTVVIFAGDNGTSPAGTIPPWKDLRSKNSPYEGGIAVPLIVSGPGVVGEGRQQDALVHVLDIFATAAELAGVDTVVDDEGLPVTLDSQSLLPYVMTEAGPTGRDFLFTEKFGPMGAPPYDLEWLILRDERWKLMRQSDGSQFYDLWDPDPLDGNEGVDLAANGVPSDPDAAAGWVRLNTALDSFLEEVQYEGPAR